MPTCGVYEIVTADGERYVGSSVNCDQRWKDHLWRLKQGKHYPQLQQAYDADPLSVQFNILEECTEKHMRKREHHHLTSSTCINKHRSSFRVGDRPITKRRGKAVHVEFADGRIVDFPNTRAAAIEISCSTQTIKNWCRGKSTTYTWPRYNIAEIRYV
jgi:hypothetical protein